MNTDELVREAADRILIGESLAAVVVDWTARGYRTDDDSAWTAHDLERRLRDPRSAGLRYYCGEVVADLRYRRAPLDVQTWTTLQAVLG